MWPIGSMVWRIGDILGVEEQIDWMQAAGFDAVSFHASAGTLGHWQGLEPAETDRKKRNHIRGRVSQFTMCEVHAPFQLEVTPESTVEFVEELGACIKLAHDVGASIVTVHATPPSNVANPGLWERNLDRLEQMASNDGVRVGLELMHGFEWLTQNPRPHLGITLDVGHMYHHNGAGYRHYGSMRSLIHALGKSLIHLHVHDCIHLPKTDEISDHCEVGTGIVDWPDVLQALARSRYQGALCLELNPDRVSPDGMRRSLDWLRQRSAE